MFVLTAVARASGSEVFSGSSSFSFGLSVLLHRGQQFVERIRKQLHSVIRQLGSHFFDRDAGSRQIVHHVLRARHILGQAVS